MWRRTHTYPFKHAQLLGGGRSQRDSIGGERKRKRKKRCKMPFNQKLDVQWPWRPSQGGHKRCPWNITLGTFRTVNPQRRQRSSIWARTAAATHLLLQRDLYEQIPRPLLGVAAGIRGERRGSERDEPLAATGQAANRKRWQKMQEEV